MSLGAKNIEEALIPMASKTSAELQAIVESFNDSSALASLLSALNPFDHSSMEAGAAIIMLERRRLGIEQEPRK